MTKLFFTRKKHDDLLVDNKVFRQCLMTESVKREWSLSGVTIYLSEANAFESSVCDDLLKLACRVSMPF
jgi:hypothetical protein